MVVTEKNQCNAIFCRKSGKTDRHDLYVFLDKREKFQIIYKLSISMKEKRKIRLLITGKNGEVLRSLQSTSVTCAQVFHNKLS